MGKDMSEKEKILIVDDEYANRFLLEELLFEFETKSAESAEEMWKVLTDFLPSLILMDVMMPKKDGFSLARKLSENEDYKHIPIIFVTAKTSGDDIEKGFSLGGYDYLKKPFDETELKVRIKAVLSRKKTENTLIDQSITDSLTKLYNRKHFSELASKQIERVRRNQAVVSVAMIDIDYFKSVNDTYGHRMGDVVLKGLADILLENIRPYDILGRYGGEEFVIMFVDCDKDKSFHILSRIKEHVREEVFRLDNKFVTITFSGGIIDTKELLCECNCLEKLIEVADERLYKAKENGRNQIIYQ